MKASRMVVNQREVGSRHLHSLLRILQSVVCNAGCPDRRRSCLTQMNPKQASTTMPILPRPAQRYSGRGRGGAEWRARCRPRLDSIDEIGAALQARDGTLGRPQNRRAEIVIQWITSEF